MQYSSLVSMFLLSMAGTVLALPQAGGQTPNGQCGGTFGFTCTGSAFGDCCSEGGFCGSTTAHCGGGCQPTFGTCSGTNESPDGSCGATSTFTCADSVFGACCSASGFCGSTTNFCGQGCQPGFSATDGTGCLAVPPTNDGSCGAAKGNLTCTGSANFDGDCCSGSGFCGTGPTFCSTLAECQPGFGAACTTP